jgi:hypothetical protein
MIKWGVFALALDVAALLHGAMVIRIVFSYSRHWAYWDAKMAGTDPGYTEDSVWDDFCTWMLLIALMWTVSIAAASIAWINIVRASDSPRTRGIGRPSP